MYQNSVFYMILFFYLYMYMHAWKFCLLQKENSTLKLHPCLIW